MREIKFKRVFFFDEEKTKFSHSSAWGVNIGAAVFASPSNNNFTLSFIDSQFIGMKDKNDIEIYEGDILQLVNDIGDTIQCVVEWGIHRRTMLPSKKEVDIAGFSFVNGVVHSFPIVKNYAGLHDLEIIEIIGNIYENPELLNS